MSYQYDQYLAKHKENVRNGFDWLQTNLPELVKDVPNLGWQTGFAHDQSKSEPDEYEAIKNLDADDERFHKLLNTIFTICELSGFHLEERIVLKDLQTGKVWR